MSEILLRRQGNLVDAQPVSGITADGVYDLFRAQFKYQLRLRNDVRTIRSTGQRFRTETKHLCRKQEGASTSVVFPAGLLHRAQALCDQFGITWKYTDLRPPLVPAPRLDRLQLDKLDGRDDQMKCLAAIFAADMGVISAPTGYGKTFTICQICRAYPDTRIIICTYRRDVVRSIFDRLRDEGHVRPKNLGLVGGGHRHVGQVTVATIDSLEHAEPDKCRIFLYDEVHEAASDDRSSKLAQIRMSKMFGFSASPKGRTDGADMVIEALFGPVIYQLPYMEAEKAGNVATISVDVIKVPGLKIPYDDDVAQFRYGIWRNTVRNQLIAKEAAAHVAQNRQTLIMVDKIEHALAIKSQFLPTWPLVHGPVHPEQLKTFQQLGLLAHPKWLCTPEQRDEYRRRFESGMMRYAIATGVWSQGVDFRHLDVLVRADGKSAPIANTQIPGRLSRGEAGLLIDFQDSFDDRFARRSQARIRHYMKEGWQVTYK